jgi:hypothetical protein
LTSAKASSSTSCAWSNCPIAVSLLAKVPRLRVSLHFQAARSGACTAHLHRNRVPRFSRPRSCPGVVVNNSVPAALAVGFLWALMVLARRLVKAIVMINEFDGQSIWEDRTGTAL